jgi:flagellar biosynthetic protein FliR
MSLEQLNQFVPTFVLVFFRVAAMCLFAPLFGSGRIPRRVRALLALVLSLGMAAGLPAAPVMPATTWALAVGIGGEMIFGVAMGMILSFVFVAVQWAGEMIGQQMGLNLSETFDPQIGGQGSLVGDLYFMFMLVLFLVFQGHHAMLRGLRDSFDAMPLLSVGMNGRLLDLLVGLFQASTALAVRLAAPMLLTMLVVDLALGFISKTVPQFNIMSAGMSLRSVVGMAVLVVGLSMTTRVMRDAVIESMQMVRLAWVGGALP